MYISEAIESILRQTYKNIELLIINDGSTDNSDSIIKSIIKKNKSRNIRYISRSNKGVVYTRNEGIKLAKGEFISFLDADDYFNPDYIEKSFKIAYDSGADIVYPNWHFVGDWEGRPNTDFPDFSNKLLQLQKLHVTPASLIRKSAIGKHRFEVEKVAEDWDFFIGLSLQGLTFKLAKDNYINYRIRKGTRSSKNHPKEDTKNFVYILKKYKKIYGNEVINPSMLVADRHPNIFVRVIRKLTPTKLTQSIKAIGVYATFLKIVRRLIVKISPLRKTARWFINARYLYNVDPSEIKKSSDVRLAVIVHLYYPDAWSHISKRLSYIKEPFDLFVSVQEVNKNIDLGKINVAHNSTTIITLPNRGRDVLPFLIVARMVANHKNYKYILKLHTKKSLHREDGSKWFKELLTQIIPKNNDEIIKKLSDSNTGVIGPEEHVVSLKRYMGGNRHHMVYVLEKITSRDIIDEILINQDKYPFFGGTMFWCRIDYIIPLLNIDLGPADFKPEKKQLDMTMAHAIERLLGNSLHKITGKKMYVVNKNGHVRPLPRKSFIEKYKYVD